MTKQIQKEWEMVKLEEIIDYIKGKKPEKMIEENKEGFLPYLSTEYLRNNGKTKFAKLSEKIVSISDNDLILLWDGANAGELFIGKKGILSSTMVKIQSTNKMLNQKFLFYSLKLKENYLRGQTKGTGIPHVDKNVLNNINLEIPPLPEQKKIAEVLSAVDEGIGKVDEAIKKTERLKNGLMQKLLTRGIGHREFKNTEIGRIPKEWEIVELGEILNLEYGRGLPEKLREGGEYPVFGSNGTVGSHSQYLVEGPGIVVGRKGTIGAIAWTEKNFWPIDTTYYTKLINLKTDLKWLFYKLSSLNLSKLNMATGTPGLNRDIAYKRKFSFPGFPEQRRIAGILADVDRKIELERKRKGKLERIKKGLMDDLLTGRKRVKI